MFDEASTRSEGLHVNLLGYVPKAPQKFGYVYHWLGDEGGPDLKAYDGRAFHLVDRNTAKSVFDGRLHFRMSSTQLNKLNRIDRFRSHGLSPDGVTTQYIAL